jgi:hypothetical protein
MMVVFHSVMAVDRTAQLTFTISPHHPASQRLSLFYSFEIFQGLFSSSS